MFRVYCGDVSIAVGCMLYPRVCCYQVSIIEGVSIVARCLF